MTTFEFQERTGYYPQSDKEWRSIIRAYHRCNDGKDTFCKLWLKGKYEPTLTEKIKYFFKELIYHGC